MQRNRRNQAGLTLVEVLLVLAIAAVAIVGGTILFSTASTNQRITQTVGHVSTLASGIRRMYSTQAQYTGVDEAFALQNDIVPTDMAVGTTAIRNAFGGQVGIQASGTNDLNFAITFENVPNGACVELVQAFVTQGAGNTSGVVGFGVGAGTGTTPITQNIDMNTAANLTVENISTQCAFGNAQQGKITYYLR